LPGKTPAASDLAISWVGLDAPLELIEAAGRRPCRIVPDLGPPGLASAYGEGGGHPWMRAVTGELLNQAAALERVVLCSTPVNELWLYNFILSLSLRGEAGAFPKAELLNISHERRSSAERLNLEAMKGLARTLSVDAAALDAAIAGRNAVRATLRRIDGLRLDPRAGISGAAARRMMDPADSLTAHDYLAQADRLLTDRPVHAGGLPVILSSPTTPDLGLYDALEAQGLRIVGDDADCGSRAIGPDVETGGDPFAALARRYANRDPAPAGWPTHERTAYLVNMAKSRGARAVLFDLPPWSHPAAWDFPAEREALQSAGIACVVLPQGDPRPAASAARDALEPMIAETADV
jgi:hypothetical protein